MDENQAEFRCGKKKTMTTDNNLTMPFHHWSILPCQSFAELDRYLCQSLFHINGPPQMQGVSPLVSQTARRCRVASLKRPMTHDPDVTTRWGPHFERRNGQDDKLHV